MKKSKKSLIFASVAVLIMSLAAILTACGGSSYYKFVSSFEFWANEPNQAMAQTHVYDMVKAHLANENGKDKKVLLLGWDGTRADALGNIRRTGLEDKNKIDKVTGDNPSAPNSAVNYLLDNAVGGEKGAAYITFAGGSDKSNFQATSTAPGWASISTGVWGNENGVPDNPNIEKLTNVKNLSKKTFMLEAAESEKYKSIFMASWQAHKVTYKSEIDYVAQNNISMEYFIPSDDYKVHDRIMNSVDDKSANYDKQDVIFAIYDWADHNGHSFGFSNDDVYYVNAVRNNDGNSYQVIKAVEARENYNNEDWLIILTSDHGGHGKSHGMQRAEARTTFLITNKPSLVKNEYFCKNYDGLKENK